MADFSVNFLDTYINSWCQRFFFLKEDAFLEPEQTKFKGSLEGSFTLCNESEIL